MVHFVVCVVDCLAGLSHFLVCVVDYLASVVHSLVRVVDCLAGVVRFLVRVSDYLAGVIHFPDCGSDCCRLAAFNLMETGLIKNNHISKRLSACFRASNRI